MKAMRTVLAMSIVAGSLGIAGAVLADDSAVAANRSAEPQPIRLTEAQMDRVVAGGEFVVDTQGQNLELVATGNSIDSCNNGNCYWYNSKSDKEIGKPVKF